MSSMQASLLEKKTVFSSKIRIIGHVIIIWKLFHSDTKLLNNNMDSSSAYRQGTRQYKPSTRKLIWLFTCSNTNQLQQCYRFNFSNLFFFTQYANLHHFIPEAYMLEIAVRLGMLLDIDPPTLKFVRLLQIIFCIILCALTTGTCQLILYNILDSMI